MRRSRAPSTTAARSSGAASPCSKDSSPPAVTASASRGPDANGWYTSPVSFSFTGDDGASGVASCTSGTYAGPDGRRRHRVGVVHGQRGQHGVDVAQDQVRRDGADRRRDAGAQARRERVVQPSGRRGLHRHRRRVGHLGVLAHRELQGAGRRPGEARRPVPRRRRSPERADDGRAPLRRHAAGAAERSGGSARRVDLARRGRPERTSSGRRSSGRPGRRARSRPSSTRAKATQFVDKKLRTGTRYWYEVTLVDQAGNAASKTIGLQPTGTRHLRARPTARSSREPPVVQWVAGEQGALLQPPALAREREAADDLGQAAEARAAASGGRRRARGTRSSTGSYRLYVWPAFGTHASPRYGKLVGQVAFVVKRR